MSVAASFSVTGPRYQPSFPDSPDGVARVTGGVLSSLIVTDVPAESPAALAAAHVSIVPGVSVASVLVEQPDDETMFDSGSVTLQLTVTFPRYQPFLP